MITPLPGHTSPETAYLAYDYPYLACDYRARCVIRYWVETAEKGACRGRQRIVSQTTHRYFSHQYTDMLEKQGQEAADAMAHKRIAEGTVVWNKPKPSHYWPIAVMYLDDEHVTFQLLTISDVADPKRLTAFAETFGPSLDAQQAARLAVLMDYSREHYPEDWERLAAETAGP